LTKALDKNIKYNGFFYKNMGSKLFVINKYKKYKKIENKMLFKSNSYYK